MCHCSPLHITADLSTALQLMLDVVCLPDDLTPAIVSLRLMALRACWQLAHANKVGAASYIISPLHITAVGQTKLS